MILAGARLKPRALDDPGCELLDMSTTDVILHQINQQHGMSFRLLDRYPTGEQGAFGLTDTTGARFVLKWAPDPTALATFQRAARITERLRGRGYPAPHYALFGRTAHGAYAIQHALPGQPLPHLPLALIPQFLELNDCQAGLAATDANTWPAPVVDPVLYGGNGFCLLAPMQTYSTTTATLLRED